MHGIGFVRGTDSSLAPVPAGTVTHELMHTTDWLPTLCGLAGAADAVQASALPLDGVDQVRSADKGVGTPIGNTIISYPRALVLLLATLSVCWCSGRPYRRARRPLANSSSTICPSQPIRWR